MSLVAPSAGMVALTFRNGGSQTPDYWLKGGRNNQQKSGNGLRILEVILR